jgi:dTDP-4-amino-4,6-dideoxygalactose transaminase
MTMKVPYFDYPSVYKRFESQFQSALAEVGSRGAFIQQSDLEDFESRIADYVGVKHCVGVANATDALQLGFMAAGLPQGAEVIISTHTMVATASAIHFAGGVPVPVGVSSDHLIKPDEVRAAITDRTWAICPTQLNGRTCDMDALLAVTEEHGLEVFEDSAQGLGSKYKGRFAGTFGKANCLSFYPAKILGTLGDGGAILTQDDEIAEKLRLLRDHGRIDRGDTAMWGFNSRLDNLSAAFLNIQFDHFGETVTRRREIAACYQERLSGIPGLTLPPAPDSDPDHFDTFQNYEIEYESRDALQEGLAALGVGTLQQWGGWPIHAFKTLGFTQELPEADALFSRMLMLPMHPALSDEDVEYVADCVVQVADGLVA